MRPFYADPGTDPDYCDRISDPPDYEAGDEDGIEVCPVCLGSGELNTDDGRQDCGECNGRGYYEE